jgi:hypothetical protein
LLLLLLLLCCCCCVVVVVVSGGTPLQAPSACSCSSSRVWLTSSHKGPSSAAGMGLWTKQPLAMYGGLWHPYGVTVCTIVDQMWFFFRGAPTPRVWCFALSSLPARTSGDRGGRVPARAAGSSELRAWGGLLLHQCPLHRIRVGLCHHLRVQ